MLNNYKNLVDFVNRMDSMLTKDSLKVIKINELNMTKLEQEL